MLTCGQSGHCLKKLYRLTLRLWEIFIIKNMNTIHSALWLTDTVFATGVRLVANVTDAAVASSQVLTYAILTDVWIQGTLIDV